MVGLVVDQNNDKYKLVFDNKYSQQAKLLLDDNQVNQNSIDLEGNDLPLLKSIIQVGILPDIVSIEHNHYKLVKRELKKLAINYGYKIFFSYFLGMNLC